MFIKFAHGYVKTLMSYYWLTTCTHQCMHQSQMDSTLLLQIIIQQLLRHHIYRKTRYYLLLIFYFCYQFVTNCQLNSIIQIKASHDFLEELKCLFLRSRDPEKNAFEELVRQIFNCDLNTTKGTDWLRAASRNFRDFCNKFLDSIEEKIDILKEKRAE